MRFVIVVLWALLSLTSAMGQVSIGISMPGVSIGINVPVFPQLVRVPGYPVYYAPRLQANFFFYDGMYWVFQGDNWYASYWYNGPWSLVAPEVVPVYVLRIPVSYYRSPPGYFRGWRPDAPPHWGEQWGHDWERQRDGWDKWDRRSAPAPAPLPLYQRQYSGNRYPAAAQQPGLHARNYRYQPREPVVTQLYQEQAIHAPPAPPRRGQERAPGPRDGDTHPSPAPQQNRPIVQDPRRTPHQDAAQPGQQAPKPAQRNAAQGQGAHEAARGQGQEKDRDKGEGRAQERDK